MGRFILTLKSKKAQAWSFDLVIASIIFIVGIVMLYFYAVNYTSQSENKLDDLFFEGNLASELILSEDSFGILTGNQINQAKLDEYLNYQQKKDELGLTKNFYFNIQNDPTNYGLVNPPDVENIVRVIRITIDNNKIVSFKLYIWE
ncbi:hypothetical protein HYT23_03680 [Candidatus Pacearchaeota archaeon]|nr:hypothetical protein [Candidatus Pacearchaeota archaeon]